MKESKEYVITAEGDVVRRQITEWNMAFPDSIVSNLASSVVRKVSRIHQIDHKLAEGPASVVCTATSIFVTQVLSELPLRTPFRLMGSVLVPNFSSPTDPVLTMSWKPVPGMQLVSLFQLIMRDTDFSSAMMWMYAYLDGRAYRLPMGNIYEDCRICTGARSSIMGYTLTDTVLGMLELFQNSQWNGDLWGGLAETSKMFGFKPKNNGFEQVPIEGDWTKLCRLVSTDVMNYVSL